MAYPPVRSVHLIEIMNKMNSPERKKRIDSSNKTEAAFAFTSRADGSRHRFRFLHLEGESGMWRVHEVKEDQTWRIVGREPVQQLKMGQTEPSANHVGHRLVE
ncbi:hypothetical protein C483_02251 [Natrialba hulunbeirensis JCM 10989]|uniref:Uncharacterized protein n=1 Tax=Natrialba hulunbeirensis JCM 10989 TaxID=1227493 RepID=M0ACS1_9EURY|nr:hypothetical protein C483_02251 [Natrialba hulunbeirensis JCM 10989]